MVAPYNPVHRHFGRSNSPPLSTLLHMPQVSHRLVVHNHEQDHRQYMYLGSLPEVRRDTLVQHPAQAHSVAESSKRHAPDTPASRESSSSTSSKDIGAPAAQGTALTAEQRAKIEANRRRALERRAKRLRH